MESGVFQTTEVKDIPYLKTDKGSLVFTIAPNGHVWGHRIENGGTKRDIELEIFASLGIGYTLRRFNSKPVGFFPENSPSIFSSLVAKGITESQAKTIRFIVDQKSSLNKLLGCIVFPMQYHSDLPENYKFKDFPSLLAMHNSINAKIVDCSFSHYDGHQITSRLKFFSVAYLDNEYDFDISSAYHGCAGGAAVSNISWKNFKTGQEISFGHCGPEILNRWHYKEGFDFFENGSKHLFPHYVVFGAKAVNKKFFVGDFPACVERKLVPNEITVLLDTKNIFDCFEIDDAMLLLEEKRLSETESELYWTVAIAHNKVLRAQKILLSNNSNLFK